MYIKGYESAASIDDSTEFTQKFMNDAMMEREFMIAMAADEARMGVLQNETKAAIKRADGMKI